MAKTETVKVGTVVFGTVGNYGPARWKYTGRRNGSLVLEHLKHPSQGTAFPEQFVSREELERLAAAH